jgi:hypothetical protein
MSMKYDLNMIHKYAISANPNAYAMQKLTFPLGYSFVS